MTLDAVLDEIRLQLKLVLGVKAAKLANADTELYRDLGMYGDDVDEFFGWYTNKYELSLTHLRFEDFFPSEGTELSRSLRAVFTGKRDHERFRAISLHTLATAALSKSWPDTLPYSKRNK